MLWVVSVGVVYLQQKCFWYDSPKLRLDCQNSCLAVDEQLASMRIRLIGVISFCEIVLMFKTLLFSRTLPVCINTGVQFQGCAGS